MTLDRDGEPERVRAARIEAGYFPVLGARPAVGRLFENDMTAVAVHAEARHAGAARSEGAVPEPVARCTPSVCYKFSAPRGFRRT